MNEWVSASIQSGKLGFLDIQMLRDQPESRLELEQALKNKGLTEKAIAKVVNEVYTTDQAEIRRIGAGAVTIEFVERDGEAGIAEHETLILHRDDPPAGVETLDKLINGDPEADFMGSLPSVSMRQLYLRMAPKTRVAFQGLNDFQRLQFTLLFQNGEQAESPAGYQSLLMALLAQGKLQRPDGQGKTVMDHFTRLMAEPVAIPADEPAVEPQYRLSQMQELMAHLFNPHVIAQGPQDTCGVTAAQKEWAFNDPPGYVALAVSLLSKEGQATLPDGRALKRPPDALARPQHDTRSATSRIFQSTLLDWASPGRYATARDGHYVAAPFIGGVKIPGTSGGQMKQMISAIRQSPTKLLLNHSAVTLYDRGLSAGITQGEILSGIQQDLARQKNTGGTRLPFVPVSLNWGAGLFAYHWINIQEIQGDQVFFTNPHGNDFEEYAHDPGFSPPLARAVLDDGDGRGPYVIAAHHDKGGPSPMRFYRSGLQSMPVSELRNRLEMAVVGG